MIVNETDNCKLCGHSWLMHDDLLHREYGFKLKHLKGGYEEDPIWCYCSQLIPKTNLEYLEYLNLVNENLHSK